MPFEIPAQELLNVKTLKMPWLSLIIIMMMMIITRSNNYKQKSIKQGFGGWGSCFFSTMPVASQKKPTILLKKRVKYRMRLESLHCINLLMGLTWKSAFLILTYLCFVFVLLCLFVLGWYLCYNNLNWILMLNWTVWNRTVFKWN